MCASYRCPATGYADKPKPAQSKTPTNVVGAAFSGDSLTVEALQRFIDSDFSGNSRTLVAPNQTVADLWSKQYPGWTILLSAHNRNRRKETLNNE